MRLVLPILISATLSACSVQRDNPNFVYPQNASQDAAWPKLTATEDLIVKTAPPDLMDQAPDAALSTRAQRLKNRDLGPSAVPSMNARVARLRAKAALLLKTTF